MIELSPPSAQGTMSSWTEFKVCATYKDVAAKMAANPGLSPYGAIAAILEAGASSSAPAPSSSSTAAPAAASMPAPTTASSSAPVAAAGLHPAYPEHPEVREMVGPHSSLMHLDAEDGLKLVYYEGYDKDGADGTGGKPIEYKGKLEDVPFQGTVEILRCNGPVTNVDGLVYYTLGKQHVKIKGLDVTIDGMPVPKSFAKQNMERGTKAIPFILCLDTSPK